MARFLDKYTTEIVGRDFQFLDSKGKSAGVQGDSGKPYPGYIPSEQQDDNDDVPF